MTSANGTSSRKWANGPSVPLTTPFREDESIDHEALAKQVVRLAKAGEGIVLLGTNGEGESSLHLSLTSLVVMLIPLSLSPFST